MSSSNHEKYLLNNTLACVANLCVGKVTTVELRDELLNYSVKFCNSNFLFGCDTTWVIYSAQILSSL